MAAGCDSAFYRLAPFTTTGPGCSSSEGGDLPTKPWVGRAESGSATSALMPQTMVVLPIRTSAEPCAVEIEPELLVYGRAKAPVNSKK